MHILQYIFVFIEMQLCIVHRKKNDFRLAGTDVCQLQIDYYQHAPDKKLNQNHGYCDVYH
jgi:hypothetical protein